MSSAININSIAPGSEVYITGTVEYSHIASQISGKELEADNAKKIKRGMKPTDKPHSRITIIGAEICYENPMNPSLAEQFIADRMYISKTNPAKGYCYTAVNKSRNLPEVFCRTDKNDLSLDPVECNQEIASGSNVTLLLRFFATNTNNGVSLDAVIVNQKPVKFARWGITNVLAKRGFIINQTATVEDVVSQISDPSYPAVEPYSEFGQTAVPYSAAMPQTYAQPVMPAPVAVPVPTPVQSVAPSLPIPPKGYVYDQNGRIVPENMGGITL